MSRIKRVLTCLLLTVLMLSLSSCKPLDEMKRHHAVWNNEDHTEILWNGAEYRKLPDLDSEFLYADIVRITDPDVPALLSKIYGRYGQTDPDGKLIMLDYTIYDGLYGARYARSDMYEKYEAEIRDPKLDHFCAAADLYPEGSDESKMTAAILSDDLSGRLEKLLASGAAEPLSEGEVLQLYQNYIGIYTDEDFNSQGSLSLYRSSEEMLLVKSFCSLNRYRTDSGDIVFILTCSEPLTQDAGDDGADDEDAYVSSMYLLKDESLYTDIMKELTKK